MSMAERIKELRIAAGLTQEELGEKVGLQKSAIAKYENGRVENIKRSTIQAMADLFGVKPSYVLGFDEDNNSPLYEAAAGEGRYNDGYPSEVFDMHLDDDEFAFKVFGRSMEPTILDGDIVIVSAQSIIDYPRQMALVRINGEESTIKRVEVKSNGIMLIADNVDVYSPRLFTQEEVKTLPVQIVGVVTKLFRRYR